MTATLGELQQLKKQALDELQTLPLENWRVKYIGRKGAVPLLLRNVKDLPEKKRKEIGKAANEIRKQLESLYEEKKRELGKRNNELGKKEAKSVIHDSSFIVQQKGHLHPLSLAIHRIQEIMSAMGFRTVEGPELEQEYYDFDALNIPFEHPARAETDSFYIAPRQKRGDGRVLRTSTSAVQVRSVIENHLVPPFKIASPGRVFRNEKPDATHESTFHQIEALAVSENMTVADYKGVTEMLFSTYFGRKAEIRLRPGFFPFVEPGFEVDMSCPFCNDGCRICKYTRWIEMGGAGMVHPNVLKNMNIDPDKFQGFAFGYGIDRFAMLWHGIDDIRLFWSGDIRFLRQFG